MTKLLSRMKNVLFPVLIFMAPVMAVTGSMYPDNAKHSGYLVVNPEDSTWQSWKSNRYLAVKDSVGNLFRFTHVDESQKGKNKSSKQKKLKLIQFNKKKSKKSSKNQKKKTKLRKELRPQDKKEVLFGKDRHVGTEDVIPKSTNPESD